MGRNEREKEAEQSTQALSPNVHVVKTLFFRVADYPYVGHPNVYNTSTLWPFFSRDPFLLTALNSDFILRHVPVGLVLISNYSPSSCWCSCYCW